MGKPTSSQTKNQKSISNFFTPRPSQQTQSQSQGYRVPPPTRAPKEPNLYDADSDEEPVRGAAKATTKRALTEDVNGANALIERPTKRAKGDDETTGSSFFAEPQRAKPAASTSKISPRTEKYLYSSSAHVSSSEPVPEDNEEDKAKKAELHKKWVKRMGGATIGRRWEIEETPGEEGEEEEEEEEDTRAKKAPKKGAKTGKLTPMELQVLDIKRKHIDTMLIVEVGYKFRFFGEDARIAAKELGIFCIPGRFRYDEHPSEAHLKKFASASFPTHRLPVHTKRLVAAGHKVGVVRQIETAALKKAGDNRNAPFIRKLTNVYTKGTYVDDIDGLDHPTEAPSGGAPATGYLLCITETKAKGWGTDEKVDVGILAVQPATGDIIYDTFEDGFMRSEMETRLLHIAPCEFLLVGELTNATEKLLKHLAGSTLTVFGDTIRVERVDKAKTMAAEAYSHVAQFYADKLKAQKDSGNEREQKLLEKVLKLPEEATICLSAMITHLTEYGLEHVFDLTTYFQSFSAKTHMLLNGNTLTSLEIYQNQTDHTEKGSLFWTLDKTQTRFGQRLLRKWVGQPLLDQTRLEERVSAVEELANGHQTPKVDKLSYLLRNIKSDLERSLIRIYYGKCTRPELLTALQTLQRISNEYANVKTPSDAGFTSSLINNAIATLPSINEAVISFLSQINGEAARTDDKYAFFREEHETEEISDHKLGIAAVESDLDAHRSIASSILKQKKPVSYVTVAGIEYLIEVQPSDIKHVPASWAKISGTKGLKGRSRFHTPEVVRMLRERDQHKESLSAACDAAFKTYLSQISAHYAPLRDAIASLSTLDCLLSLSLIALLPKYSKPTFSPVAEIQIEGGRHPMVEALLPTYIPNDTSLSTAENSTRALLITGPNMGGKSSYVRQTALIVIMAQIGSFVPATSARLGLLDSIHTRMGAFDSLFTQQSTFQVELSETSAILKTATPRSLVILDELGRGTSTHDGVAIAGSVLDWVVRETKCLCLFITHYQSLAGVARGFERGGELRNVHMKFTATKASGVSVGDMDVEEREKEKEKKADGDEEITFLYEVGEGVAHRSYGLNVARLAHVPKPVIEKAAIMSHKMEMETKQKKLLGLSKIMTEVLSAESSANMEQLLVEIDEL